MPPLYRILHIVASMQGGAAQHVLHLAQAFLEQDHTAAISAPSDNPPFEKRIRDLGVPFHDAPLDSPLPFEAILKLRTILESESWTHIHIHGHRAALIGRLASLLTRNSAPIIYTVHGYHPPYYFSPFSQNAVNGMERVLSRWTDFFICVSRSTQNDLLGVLPQASSRCAVVENAVPLPAVSEIQRRQLRDSERERYSIPPDAFVVGTVGRLQWQKAVSRLIRAFRIVWNNRENVFLLIVGDGPLRLQMETLADSLQIGDRCRFTGHRENPLGLYCAMDLFVLSSLWEGLPLTILEAWSAGIPVAATNVPGSRDLIEDGITGFLAENSIHGIAQAIQRARAHPERIPAMLRNAQTVLNQRFSLQRMIAQTKQVYQRTMKTG